MNLLPGLLAALTVITIAFVGWKLGARSALRLGKGAGEVAAGAALVVSLLLIAIARWHPVRFSPAVALSPLVYLEFCYFVPTVSFFLGLAGHRVPRPETRRAVAALAGVVALYAAIHVFLTFWARDLPQLSSSPPPGPVQAQTTNWSCGPASCVTLLASCGIASTEREMGELCMTLPYRGTTLPRFVRGLTLKLRDAKSPLRVLAKDRMTMEDLDAFPRPCLLGIRGGLLTGHAVVLLGKGKDGMLRVADPLGGGRVNYLTRPELARVFDGDAIAIVE